MRDSVEGQATDFTKIASVSLSCSSYRKIQPGDTQSAQTRTFSTTGLCGTPALSHGARMPSPGPHRMTYMLQFHSHPLLAGTSIFLIC